MKRNVKRVFIIDDSRISREIIKKAIEEREDLIFAGEAEDPYEARERIIGARPDVVTLDIQMPKMDGITFLKHLMKQYPLPVVVISGNPHRVFEAMDAGAVDFVAKPKIQTREELQDFLETMIDTIRGAVYATVNKHPKARESGVDSEGKRIHPGEKTGKGRISLIAIGASTGGTETVLSILKQFPREMPPIVVVQHMPPVFTRSYARRLDEHCEINVKEGEHGEFLQRGYAYIAPGGKMMRVDKQDNRPVLKISNEDKISGHIPSVDGLFYSITTMPGLAGKTIGVILTGMGYDGAKGLLELRRRKAHTIGQDEKSSIIYGMPRAAFTIGAVAEQLPVEKIAKAIYNRI